MTSACSCVTTGGSRFKIDLFVPCKESFLNFLRIGCSICNNFGRNARVNIFINNNLGHSAEIKLCHGRSGKLDRNASVTSGDDLLIGINGAVGRQNAHRSVGGYGFYRSIKNENLSYDLGDCCVC